MADKKISQLTAVSTPLAGTEVLPIVQSGSTKKVTALELTGTTVDASGNVILSNGNLVQGTAAKGINFTANTPAAGMTSQLLNWYEEGTWTPTVTAFSGSYTTVTINSATYTRIGRLMTINVDYTINVNGTGSGATLIGNLPFSISGGANSCVGAAKEIAISGVAGTINANSTTNFVVVAYNNTHIGGNGARVLASVTYNT